jgi:methionyl-tRNA formyltransferase
MIRKEDGLIDWRRSATDIERQIRAFIPWPNAFTSWDGKMLKILEGQIEKKVLEPGYVVVLNRGLIIGCGKDSINITRVQIEDKNEMLITDFLNGYRKIDGAILH